MKLLKQALAVLGTVVVIAVLVALVTPKTAHAVIATAVQVVNTSAQAVPVKDVDAPGRNVFQLELFPGLNGFTVPTTVNNQNVQALVITEVAGRCFASPFAVMLNGSSNSSNLSSMAFRVESSTDVFNNYPILPQLTRIYLNPGDTLTLSDGGASCAMNLYGYYVAQ
jgi:hypothetical protein